MAVIFVARHHGAIEWMKQQGITVDRHELHFSSDQVREGDWVIGILPIHLISEVCARGARYWHLSMSLPFELRGKELSAQQLDQLGAELVEYQVKQLGNFRTFNESKNLV